MSVEPSLGVPENDAKVQPKNAPAKQRATLMVCRKEFREVIYFWIGFASTTELLPDSDAAVTASFAPPLHFVYR
jgi:hypothetical protein